MITLLTPFKLTTDALQAENTPTIQLVTRSYKLQKVCSPAEGTDSLSVLLLKKRLRENLHRLNPRRHRGGGLMQPPFAVFLEYLFC